MFHFDIASSLNAPEKLLNNLNINEPSKRKSVVKITITDESGQTIDHQNVDLDIDATNGFWQDKIKKIYKHVDDQGDFAYYTSLKPIKVKLFIFWLKPV